MRLSKPFFISSRLLPAIAVAGATVQLERVGRTFSGRDTFQYTIDLPNSKKPRIGADLHSGCQGCSLQAAFGTLLAFLSAFGEALYWDSRRKRGERAGENSDLFKGRAIATWARENYEEIDSVRCDIEEGRKTLIEEDRA